MTKLKINKFLYETLASASDISTPLGVIKAINAVNNGKEKEFITTKTLNSIDVLGLTSATEIEFTDVETSDALRVIISHDSNYDRMKEIFRMSEWSTRDTSITIPSDRFKEFSPARKSGLNAELMNDHIVIYCDTLGEEGKRIQLTDAIDSMIYCLASKDAQVLRSGGYATVAQLAQSVLGRYLTIFL